MNIGREIYKDTRYIIITGLAKLIDTQTRIETYGQFLVFLKKIFCNSIVNEWDGYILTNFMEFKSPKFTNIKCFTC